MSADLSDISRLLPMLEMAYQAEQVKMAQIVARIRGLKGQMAELNRPKSANDGLSAATMAGVDLLWEGWVQDRKTLINRELALASRDREAAKRALVAALSKFEAAKQLHKTARSEVAKLTERRSSW